MRARLLVNVPRADIVTDRSGSPAAPGLLQTGRWDETDRLERSNDPSRPSAAGGERRLSGNEAVNFPRMSIGASGRLGIQPFVKCTCPGSIFRVCALRDGTPMP
jgi:hypothetical protein